MAEHYGVVVPTTANQCFHRQTAAGAARAWTTNRAIGPAAAAG